MLWMLEKIKRASDGVSSMAIEISIIHATVCLCWTPARVRLTERNRSHVVLASLSEIQTKDRLRADLLFGVCQLDSLGECLT